MRTDPRRLFFRNLFYCTTLRTDNFHPLPQQSRPIRIIHSLVQNRHASRHRLLHTHTDRLANENLRVSSSLIPVNSPLETITELRRIATAAEMAHFTPGKTRFSARKTEKMFLAALPAGWDLYFVFRFSPYWLPRRQSAAAGRTQKELWHEGKFQLENGWHFAGENENMSNVTAECVQCFEMVK